MNAAWEDAIKRGDVPTLLDLLKAGSDVDAGKTAFDLAEERSMLELAAELKPKQTSDG